MTVTTFNLAERVVTPEGKQASNFFKWCRALVDEINDPDIGVDTLMTGAGSEAAPALVIGALASGGMYSTANTLYWTTNGTTRMRLNGGNLFIYGAVGVTNGNVFLYADASGKLTLTNVSDSDFNILRLGGNTSSCPAIKKNATKLAVRLADDSADAGLTAKDIAASDTVTATASTANANGVNATGNGTGAGISATGGATGYAAVLSADTTTPVRAALRIVPQDTDPSGPQEGDVYFNSASHKLRFYNGTAWGDV